MKPNKVYVSDLEKQVVALINDKKIKEASIKIVDSLGLKMKSDKDRAFKYAKSNINDHLTKNLKYMKEGYVDYFVGYMKEHVHDTKGKFKQAFI